MGSKRKENYAEFDEARLNFIRKMIDPDNYGNLRKDPELAKKFLAVVMAYMLDEEPDFISLVSKYRRKFEDKLLIDNRLM